MGIADLFNNADKKEQNAIRLINENEPWINGFIQQYHSAPDFNRRNQLDERDLLLYVKADLYQTYMNELDAKDKDAKYFFKAVMFKEHCMFSIKKIYELVRQVDTVSKKHPEIAERAQESLNMIFENTNRFDNSQRRR